MNVYTSSPEAKNCLYVSVTFQSPADDHMHVYSCCLQRRIVYTCLLLFNIRQTTVGKAITLYSLLQRHHLVWHIAEMGSKLDLSYNLSAHGMATMTSTATVSHQCYIQALRWKSLARSPVWILKIECTVEPLKNINANLTFHEFGSCQEDHSGSQVLHLEEYECLH